jgi:protein SCO1
MMRALLLLLPLVLVACRSEHTYPVEGRVVGFSDDGRTLYVDHEAIPGFMDAMTMPFRLAEGDTLPASVQIGDAVGFTLHVSPGASWIADLVRMPDSAVAISPSGQNNVPIRPDAGPAPAAVGEAIPDARLVTHTGDSLTFSGMRGKALVVGFLYTRCPLPDYCPAIAARHARLVAPLRERFADRARLVMVTLDPLYDTPARLAAYRARFSDAPDAAWPFLTGDTTEVDRIVTTFGVYRRRTGPAELDHSLVTALVSPDGRLRRVWRDLRWTNEEFFAEVASVLGPGDAPSRR